MSKTQTAAADEPIKSARIVWNTVRDFMIAKQDTTGNLYCTQSGSGNEYPNERVDQLFDEEVGNWKGSYMMPAIFGDTSKITSNPSTFLSTIPTELNGIPLSRVFKSVVKKITKPFDGSSSCFNCIDLSGNEKKILNSVYYKSGFSYRLRPRVPITAAEYGAIVTSWDSTNDINKNIAQKLDFLSHLVSYEPEFEFSSALLPKSYLFPLNVQSNPGSSDANYPYVIIATIASITIDYYWR